MAEQHSLLLVDPHAGELRLAPVAVEASTAFVNSAAAFLRGLNKFQEYTAQVQANLSDLAQRTLQHQMASKMGKEGSHMQAAVPNLRQRQSADRLQRLLAEKHSMLSSLEALDGSLAKLLTGA